MLMGSAERLRNDQAASFCGLCAMIGLNRSLSGHYRQFMSDYVFIMAIYSRDELRDERSVRSREIKRVHSPRAMMR